LPLSRNEPPEREALERDLGLGGRVVDQQRSRILNRDGTFNVERSGLPGWGTEDIYHQLLTIPWSRFHLLVIAAYLGANLLFAVGYFLCGPGALLGSEARTGLERFAECFFFSVQTLGTIGYGKMSPQGLPANVLVTMEALLGLMGFAFATGLLFARFSRPSARLLFSEQALIAPYRAGRALMFRVMNARVASEITEVHATVTLSLLEERNGRRTRRFFPLTLERDKVMFLPTQWVVVHPIDEQSPLWTLTAADLHRAEAEVLILLAGIDETFTQTVHARSSYRHDEIVWEARFEDMNATNPNGITRVQADKLSAYERL
jgi:inward rectifier potassium channel